MSYIVYTSEAIVCGSFLSNTADKTFLLFTKSAGMVYASARSVREERSRQRYALQDFSVIQVSLIRGKAGWRIGSVEGEQNIFGVAASREARGSVVRVLKLMRRYVQGEEPHPALYDECKDALVYLARPDITRRVLAEEIITARILYQLGYMRDLPALAGLYQGDVETVVSGAPDTILPTLQAATAEALAVSHL
jgi:recombinational DNA repair protein (RecF pathway)